MKWLRRLFGLCDHHWEVLHETSIYTPDGDQRPIGSRYDLQCKNCGNIKFVQHLNGL